MVEMQNKKFRLTPSNVYDRIFGDESCVISGGVKIGNVKSSQVTIKNYFILLILCTLNING